MKIPTILIIFCLGNLLVECKIKLMIKETTTEKSKLRLSDDFGQISEPSTTFITLMEGSNQSYSVCNSICRDMGKPNYYTEVTDFPGYGYIFRCQCGENYTKWFNMENLNELSIDIMLGDTLFNDYLNLLGYDTDNCQCDSLKEMLHRLIETN